MLLLHEMNRKKINQEIIKRKERKKYKQEREEIVPRLLSLCSSGCSSGSLVITQALVGSC
jgi:hypothetical protein